jgi:hypothetical protein
MARLTPARPCPGRMVASAPMGNHAAGNDEREAVRNGRSASVDDDGRRTAVARLAAAARQALSEARAGREALERAHSHALRRAMAAELAPWLVEGIPCGVCGATVHPRPAGPTADGEVESSRVALLAAERLEQACSLMLATLPATESGDRATTTATRNNGNDMRDEGQTGGRRTLH